MNILAIRESPLSLNLKNYYTRHQLSWMGNIRNNQFMDNKLNLCNNQLNYRLTKFKESTELQVFMPLARSLRPESAKISNDLRKKEVNVQLWEMKGLNGLWNCLNICALGLKRLRRKKMTNLEVKLRFRFIGWLMISCIAWFVKLPTKLTLIWLKIATRGELIHTAVHLKASGNLSSIKSH